MIQIRDIFQLKFGKARDATALFQEGIALMRSAGASGEVRLLTDVTGPYYTLVLESSYESLAAYEQEMRRGMSDPAWKAWYARVPGVVDSGRREIFNVVGSVVPPFSMTEGREAASSPR
jgi:hypothetical protein